MTMTPGQRAPKIRTTLTKRTVDALEHTIPFMIAFGNFVVSILMVWGIRFLKGSRDHAFK